MADRERLAQRGKLWYTLGRSRFGFEAVLALEHLQFSLSPAADAESRASASILTKVQIALSMYCE
jgi:hypothetical protein